MSLAGRENECIIGDYKLTSNMLHDDVIKCKHFPRYWPIVRGLHRLPVNSLTKARDAELWCFLWSAPWINAWVNNREAGDLMRHRAHYDVIVMICVSVVLAPFQNITWGVHDMETISTFLALCERTIGHKLISLLARFMGPTWGPSGADMTQVGPMLVPWTLLSGTPHKGPVMWRFDIFSMSGWTNCWINNSSVAHDLWHHNADVTSL